jgi:hypothetical protein
MKNWTVFDEALRGFLEPLERDPTTSEPRGLDVLGQVSKSDPVAYPLSAPKAHDCKGSTTNRPVHLAEALPFLVMPLDRFAQEGASLEVHVPWFDTTLWIVPARQDATRLMGEGVRQGRIWTAQELSQLMSIADRIPATVKTIAHAKLQLDGEITEVRTCGRLR